MARLIPKINPDEIENSGERMLAKSLISQLGAEVEVYHSFRWLAENERGTLDEGECDFVILDPANGMLFIEVKGGTLRYNEGKDSWEGILSNGRIRKLSKSPFDQCSRKMYKLLDRIEKERPFIGNGKLPFTFGYAVAFPHSRYEGTLPMGIHRDLVLDDSKCEDLKRSIQAVYDRWRKYTHPPLGTPEMDGVRTALFPKFGILPVLWRQVEDQEERLRRLTDMQRQLLDFMAERKLAAICGVAGSGKTILAMAKAQELARSGMRTLFLCFNKPLKDWIKKVMQAIINSPDTPKRLPKGARKHISTTISLRDILTAIQKKHSVIYPLMTSNLGMQLFRKESDILVDVLLTLQKHDVVALPIHDAVLVADEDKETAVTVMKDVFKEYTGITPEVTH